MTRRDLFAAARALITVPSVFGDRVFAFRAMGNVSVGQGMWITPDDWIVLFHEDGHYEIWSDSAFRRLFVIIDKHSETSAEVRPVDKS